MRLLSPVRRLGSRPNGRVLVIVASPTARERQKQALGLVYATPSGRPDGCLRPSHAVATVQKVTVAGDQLVVYTKRGSLQDIGGI